MMVRRGEIYWAEFAPVIRKRTGRAAARVGGSAGHSNRYSPTTIVVAITRTIPPKPYPFIVVIEPQESGLPERSAVNCSQLVTIQQTGSTSRLRPPKGETEVRPIGGLDSEKMLEVDRALKYNLGLT